MVDKKYYLERIGKVDSSIALTFEELKRLFGSTFERLEQEGYFVEAFGQSCIDKGFIIGTWGKDLDLAFYLKLKKKGLWPVLKALEQYSEHDLFAVVELLYDCVSKPTYKNYHSWNDCGYHFGNFDKEAGQVEFRNQINDMLQYSSPKYELSNEGEILEVPEIGIENVLKAALPRYEPDTVENRVRAAILKFRRYSSSSDDRKDAVKTLFDVLEYLRPQIKDVLGSKDEGDLFNIANNFSIRHHSKFQQEDYDQEVWLKWIFYTCLSTTHLLLEILTKRKDA